MSSISVGYMLLTILLVVSLSNEYQGVNLTGRKIGKNRVKGIF
jgi:hypothetical protein